MRPTRKRTAIDPHGLQVVGPGFYLWDSDPREALRLAAELGRRLAPPPTTSARPRPAPRTPLP